MAMSIPFIVLRTLDLPLGSSYLGSGFANSRRPGAFWHFRLPFVDVNDPTAKAGGFLEPCIMVFEPPQHGPLGRLTAPPSADILRGSAPRRFRFYVGAYPQQRHIEISDGPFGFVRRTAET